MTKQLQIGVKALIFKGQHVTLIRRTGYSDANLDGLWDIPGGRIDIGEEPEDGLKREIAEEVGNISFSIDKPVQVRSIVNDKNRHIVRITYIGKYIDGSVKLGSEHSEFRWCDLKKLPKNTDKLAEEAIKEYLDG